jgi:LemA protein
VVGGLITGAVVVVLVLFFVTAYNGLVALRNRVQNAWAQIDVQLKRRYDLVPNLVETVKGYAAHEKDVFERVTEARAKAMAAQTVQDHAQAENELSQALFNLRAVAENYPELRANENFKALQDELTNTEDRIAFSRQSYNDTIARYDTRRQSIPYNIVAALGSFQAFEYFEADPDSRTPVQVQF